ncbi:hypothetical protein [Paraglaciecola sp. 25GB23A]|uniref:DUF7668 domain-containing protein n=1 Tax=Paraglaciecola sp. 25GB23A TaxID=3156068 RepID=UPI0032AEA3C0
MEALKDLEKAHPIASYWRPLICEVVNAIVEGDYSLSRKFQDTVSIPDDTATANRNYISDYGETLVPLQNETWESSCAQWMGDHWDIIIDLFTESEGLSDLVLTGKVCENNVKIQFKVGLIYVP